MAMILKSILSLVQALLILNLTLLVFQSDSAPQAFRRDTGHPHWHHGAFHDVRDSTRLDVQRMLHSRAEVPFQVPLEVNVLLIGFNGDGGYRYKLETKKFEELLRHSFPSHRPMFLETGEPLDIEHQIVYNAILAGQPELIALEKALKGAMIPAGNAREMDYGKEVPLFEVDATSLESVFQKLYSFIFGMDDGKYSSVEMDKPFPSAIFIMNFDKVRMDPRNKDIDLDGLMYGKVGKLTEKELEKQESDYIYRYRYNGGGASQVWLGSGRYAVIDLSAGPCTYGKIETEEGSVSSKSLPRLRNVMLPKNSGVAIHHTTHDIFLGQLASLISTTIEHVLAPDVRFQTVDLTTRLLIPIIVLQNHNRYNILFKGDNYSIDVASIESEVRKMIHHQQEVVMVGGLHPLHHHEKLAIAVSKAMRGHSLQETKKDGRFHVRTKTYLDGAILKEEMERSADVLAAGIIEMADTSLSSKFFFREELKNEYDGSKDSVLRHKPLLARRPSNLAKETKSEKENQQRSMRRTYGTRVIPVFVLSLADVNPDLTMDDESLVWTSNEVVIVLQHQNENIPLSYVSETARRHAVASQAERHILSGLASVVGGLSAPYEKASHVHERPVSNWLWATGCHPFGPFSNASHLSQILIDVALRNTVYARVDSALRKIRDTSEAVEAFAAEYLKTPIGEPVKGKKRKSNSELWLEKFYKKTSNLPEPFPHDLVERLEKFLDSLEEQLVELSALLYDHRLQEAHLNSTNILQSSIFTKKYVDHILGVEREKMRCCAIEYKHPDHSSQTVIYGGILIAGSIIYFLVIFFSSPLH